MERGVVLGSVRRRGGVAGARAFVAFFDSQPNLKQNVSGPSP